ncbi:hypothetical protein AVEN_149449-1 [Araneus ventricosus]|uniref:Uncharacterized protein n=1 Tax=Araneus ventricosus TaxID=182803 RepID=A0A4Y2JEP3_ARAVE|nr:hypothetical protein AVEN_149449-1 [Araneus ventricosus]
MENEEGGEEPLGGSNLVSDSGSADRELCDQLGFKVPNQFGLWSATPRNRQFPELSAHQLASTSGSLVVRYPVDRWKLSIL